MLKSEMEVSGIRGFYDSIARLYDVTFKFNRYDTADVMAVIARRFEVMSHRCFSAWEPIGWSKTAILTRKL